MQQMVTAAHLKGNETVLDVATGAGHTAIAFAPHVKQCIGVDITPSMIRVATQLADERQVSNVRFQFGDATALPFPDHHFDRVTCRFAAHHFTSLDQSITEVARVLKPGGSFLLIDHYAPEDEELDIFINQLDQMRDPSHVREYTPLEWKEKLLAHGMSYQVIKDWDLPIQIQPWFDRANTSTKQRAMIVNFLQNAPARCKQIFSIKVDQHQVPYSFCLKAMMVQGRK